MPFCRECAFEVQATWKFCPNCNATQPQTDSSPSIQEASVNLNDSIVAGDVNITQNNVEEMKTAMNMMFEQQEFSKFDLKQYVAMVWVNTFLKGNNLQGWLERVGKCFDISDTSAWRVYGDYKNTKTKMPELVFLVPVDDAITIRSWIETMVTLRGVEFTNLPIWLTDHMNSPAGRGIPEKVKKQLEDCRHFGSH